LLGLLDVQLDKQPRPSKLMKNLDLKCQTIQYYVSESYFLIPLPSQLKEMDHLAGRMTVKIEDLGDQEFSAMEIDPDAKIPIIFLREHVEVFGRFKSIYFVNTKHNRDLILSMQDSWKNIFRPGIQDVASAGEYRMLLPKIYSILKFKKIQKVIHLQRSGEIMSSWEDFQRESLNGDDDDDDDDDGDGDTTGLIPLILNFLISSQMMRTIKMNQQNGRFVLASTRSPSVTHQRESLLLMEVMLFSFFS
jgi:hypothetical protein